MQCLPDNLKDRVYYHPTEEGIEKRIKARLEEIRQAKTHSPQRHRDTEIKKIKEPNGDVKAESIRDPREVLKNQYFLCPLCLRGESLTALRRCSFRMHLSMTTKMPAWRALSAAASCTTPSCIQIAGTSQPNRLFHHLRHKFRPAEDIDDVDLLRHLAKRRISLLAQRLANQRIHRNDAVSLRLHVF